MKIDYDKVPHQYARCFRTDCPKAATCLRRLAAEAMPASEERCMIVSPKYLATVKGECPYYRSSEKIRYAKGFIGMLNALPYKEHCAAVSCLKSMFHGRNYYRVRKGERLLSPDEQSKVLNLLKKLGAKEPFIFDAYVEDFAW